MESESLLESDLFKPSNSEDVKDILNSEILKEEKNKLELEKLADVAEDHQLNKNLNVREFHETSPFRQAVKGFVLSKLSKKVGSSHILSGLTEKIVKKLEDKDASQTISVHNSESDLSLSSLRIKEASTEVISSSVSCELKSVVANDLALSETLNIEDAVECVEEPKPIIIGDIDNAIEIPQKNEFRSSSISLPSSPAHRFTKRASSVSCSLENSESPKIYLHSSNLTLPEEIRNNDFMSENVKYVDEIELTDIKHNSGQEAHVISDITYPKNIYCCEKEDMSNFKIIIWRQITSFLYIFKNMFSSLTMSHFFLLASVIIHNISIISSYIAFIFDGFVIAFICYAYICVVMQQPALKKTSNFNFADPHLENASIYVQKSSKVVKGSVKVLKGEYDPDVVKHQSTELVDISIENCCLKIYAPKKKKDAITKLNSFTFYDLVGATVSLVPKGLSKKRVWNKKYPICIAFHLASKKTGTPDSCCESDSAPTDYLSLIHGEINDPNKKALYFFALTDREKESLFWAISKNTGDNDIIKCDEQSCGISPKIDFSSLSYTTLLELNSEESTSQSKDTYDDESSIIEKENTALEFENYMKNLFENFERMIKFSPRSRSFEDLSNLKDDISRHSDSFTSKDDSFVSSNSKEYSVDWLNLVLGRVFYDFLTQKCWSDEVKARIQKKLNKIEMPSFIGSLEVSDVYLGTSLPQIHTVSNPVTDVNGIWFNFDFNYCGTFQMTLKTILNVTKAKQLPVADSEDAVYSKQNVHLPPSSESEDDEDTEAKNVSNKKKLIDRIEKWISHKHFQTVAQSRFVKKYVGDLSNMPLALTVELNTLHGTLVLNIPPAPTDRIWYGFKKDPVLSLNAYPRVGTHEINLSAVVQMIEKKLIQEFKKALVMPNMDDLLIPVMHSPIYEL